MLFTAAGYGALLPSTILDHRLHDIVALLEDRAADKENASDAEA
jgi:hypothetical protein